MFKFKFYRKLIKSANKMITEILINIFWFCSSSLLPVIVFNISFYHFYKKYYTFENAVIVLIGSFILNIVMTLIFLKGRSRQIGMCASFLGTVFAAGVIISKIGQSNVEIIGWYLCVMAFFHYSEFLFLAIANPASVSIDSFMLNHSYAYGIAIFVSWIEFGLEFYLVPEMKKQRIVSQIGLLMCLLGECIRKIGILTAGTNFHHIIQTELHDDHVLVTRGIYGFCRHPGYVGWFYWCIGTQLILINPICAVAYGFYSWMFFKERITTEERLLVEFFAGDYINYRQRVPSGLPFIRGYI